MLINYFIVFGIILKVSTVSSKAIIQPFLEETLQKVGEGNVFFKLTETPNKIYDEFKKRSFTSRSAKIETLINTLKKHSKKTQQPIIDILSAQGVTQYKSFWITNEIYVPRCSATLVSKLKTHESIGEIREEQIKALLPIEKSNPGYCSDQGVLGLPVQWGVNLVTAPEAWKCGVRGEGVIVGSIDTGVRVTHVALKDNYLGYWYDPVTNSSTPFDRDGHGTHTMGTICGRFGIGVAPNAKWISCLGCPAGGCPDSVLIACGQFMLCPSNPISVVEIDEKLVGPCEGIPDLVSNSWGGSGYDPFYEGVVDAWRIADIFPVFANGNSGPDCGTSNSPGRYFTVISVGAIWENKTLAWFSSRGLTNDSNASIAHGYKPDISAPGVRVASAWGTGDRDILTISGTSMATPHTAGVIALMLSGCKNSSRNYEAIKAALLQGATTEALVRPDEVCEIENQDPAVPLTFPNNEFGMGLVNAVNSLRSYCSKNCS